MVHAQIGFESKHKEISHGKHIQLIIAPCTHPPQPFYVIIDDNSQIWLIDWEHAGFYPQWFEYTAMCNADWKIFGRWEGWVIGFVARWYEHQTRFVSQIGWAIHMGHLFKHHVITG